MMQLHVCLTCYCFLSKCSVLQSYVAVLSADQSWYIAVAAVLYNQLSVALISPSCCSCHHHHSYLLSVGFSDWSVTILVLSCHYALSCFSTRLYSLWLFQRQSCCPDDYGEIRRMISVLSIADLRLYSRWYRGHVHRSPLTKLWSGEPCRMCHACCSHMCYALSHQYHAAVALSLL